MAYSWISVIRLVCQGEDMLPLQRVGEKLAFGSIGSSDFIFLTKAGHSAFSLDLYFFGYNLAKCSTFA